MTPASKRNRVLRVFNRSGGSGPNTRPFDELDPGARRRVLGELRFREHELPILACYLDAGRWVVLTSERLVRQSAGETSWVDWAEIEDATLDLNEAGQAVSSGTEGKLTLKHLRVILRGGGTLELELETGTPFVAFWNVLKTIAAIGRPA